MASSSANKPAPRTYVSGGQMLSSPPLTARLRTAVQESYNFLGLYVTTFFAFDPYAAAAASSFATQNRAASASGLRASVPRGSGPARNGNGPLPRSWGSGGGGGGGSGSGSGNGSGSGGRRLGTVDDVRGPECSSCR